jgi:hypothetical protein
MEFTETIESRPAMAVNCRSSGVATEFAIVAGSDPGRLADSDSVGKSSQMITNDGYLYWVA